MKIKSSLLIVAISFAFVISCSKKTSQAPIPVSTPEYYILKGDTCHADIHHNGYTGTYDTITAYCDTCNSSSFGSSSTLYILFGDSVRAGNYIVTSNNYPTTGQAQLYISGTGPYFSIGTGSLSVSISTNGKKNVIGHGIQMLNATNISDTSVLSLNITP